MKTSENKLYRFRPSGLNETITDLYGIEVFYSTEKLTAIFYAGNSSKSWWYFRFTSLDEMIKRIYSSVDNKIRIEDEKIEKRNKNKLISAFDFYSIGDVIVNTWGYEQTNVDFYQVVSMTNRQIKVSEISSKMVENSMYSHGMACEVIPDKNNFIKDGDNYTLTVKCDGVLSCPEKYYYMRKYDGRPEYKSWYY